MNAVMHTGANGIDGLKYMDLPDIQPGIGEVKVRLKTAGLNRRDLFLMEQRTGQEAAWIPGSDGAGIVEALGDGVTGLAIGDEVIINPCIGWEQASQVPAAPAILGGPSNGTFAEAAVIPRQNAVPKPAYLSWEEAGVLSLSALTAYRALFTKGALQPGQHILIPGIGGGVATFAALMSTAIGAEVTVTSRSEEKRRRALRLPAARALDSGSDWAKQLGRASVNLIIDSIGPALYAKYFDVIRPGGSIVLFGATSGAEITLPVRDIFYPQINILGTSMGSAEEYAAMLRLMEQYRLRPVVDAVYPVTDIATAFQRMKQGDQFGNIAIRMA